MPVSAIDLWILVAFTGMLAAMVLLTYAAYSSLRAADDVVLRARMYMNRHRLFSGFRALVFAMIALFGTAAFQIAYIVATAERPPAGYSNPFVAVSFVLLLLSFYYFFALSRAPTATGGSEEK